jgi:hypothetical protein
MADELVSQCVALVTSSTLDFPRCHKNVVLSGPSRKASQLGRVRVATRLARRPMKGPGGHGI